MSPPEQVESSPADKNGLSAIFIVVVVALVCALLVSVTAIKLRPIHVANQTAEQSKQIAFLIDALSNEVGEVDESDVNLRVVELVSGVYDEQINAALFDAKQAAAEPSQSIAIPGEFDVAGLGRRALHATVFEIQDKSGALRAVILPVSGSGYQSTLYGYLALSGDLSSVIMLRFYEHGETPGIGSRIQDPQWESLWRDKRVFDAQGRARLGVAYGQASGDVDDTEFQVDAIAGATRTSIGVDNLLAFWLGPYGFGPYLDRLRLEEGAT